MTSKRIKANFYLEGKFIFNLNFLAKNLSKSLEFLDRLPKFHKISIVASVIILTSLPVIVFGTVTARSFFSEASTALTASYLRATQLRCDSSGRTGRVRFSWYTSDASKANFWLDLSVNQNPSQRWNRSSPYFKNYHLRTVTSFTATLPSNVVYFWRVWSAHTRRHSYGKAFVVCNSQPTGAPVSGYLSSFLGPSHPLGIDIAQSGTTWSRNQIVYSTMSGVVTRKEWAGNYGNTVDIWHPNTKVKGVSKSVLVRYSHLLSFDPGIRVGQIIPWGKRLGVWGSTGRSSGVHVHYEVRLGRVNYSANRLSTSGVTDPLRFNIHRWLCPRNTTAAGKYCVASPLN